MITVVPALDRRQRPVNRVLATAVLPNRFLTPTDPATPVAPVAEPVDDPSDGAR